MHRVRYLLIFIGFLTVQLVCQGQQPIPLSKTAPPSDTLHPGSHKASPYAVDSLARKKHDPRKATIRSAIIPGWGQIYNHKYWKLPIVYAAVGIPVGTYLYNRTWYRNFQQAISIVDYYAQLGNTSVPDSVVNKLPGKIQVLVVNGFNQENALRTYRNEYRKDEDYSVLFFLLFWGLNVVDATVDAHLMNFDVSDQLSMHLQQPSPGFMIPGSGTVGLSLVFELHKPRFRPLSFQ
ncbi:MAG TPA: DUF5683 domain-containing protein [Puia sp.]|jgi:hypothetical protein|nr:DUF5683 domain-containing protein [Puia sp.]